MGTYFRSLARLKKKLTGFRPCLPELGHHGVRHQPQGNAEEGSHEGQPDDEAGHALQSILGIRFGRNLWTKFQNFQK
jgi:hypothetical protein